MADVTYSSVVKRFGEVTAVREFTLRIDDGEFLVLVGPSGSGKTTALRLLAGLETPSEGEIRIGDRVVNRVAPRDRDIAMVFQDYALYPQMTVAQNLAFALKMRRTPRAEVQRRVQRAAEMLDIGELLHRKPRELSGGQRQRVALGRALVRDPQVFLMDEPLSNLDAKLRAQTRSEIRRLQERVGTTTLYVTHDQVEAMTMGDRVAVMRDGVIEQVADTRTLYEHPANVFVAGFIGSPAMSFGTFDVVRDDAGLSLSRNGASYRIGDARSLPEVAGRAILGVRPEHAHHWREGQGLVGPFDGRVEFAEMLGRETLVGARLADDVRFTVTAPADSVLRQGDPITFGFERGRLYLFDAGSQASLGVL